MISSRVESSMDSDNAGKPKIRSTLILSTPESLRMPNARRAPDASWRRRIHRNMPSSSDWTPMLTRFTPSASSERTYSTPRSTMSSGLTSMVNSSNGPHPIAETVRSNAERGSTDGVPPPIYSVLSPTVSRISWRLRSISERSSDEYLPICASPRLPHAVSE